MSKMFIVHAENVRGGCVCVLMHVLETAFVLVARIFCWKAGGRLSQTIYLSPKNTYEKEKEREERK